MQLVHNAETSLGLRVKVTKHSWESRNPPGNVPALDGLHTWS